MSRCRVPRQLRLPLEALPACAGMPCADACGSAALLPNGRLGDLNFGRGDGDASPTKGTPRSVLNGRDNGGDTQMRLPLLCATLKDWRTVQPSTSPRMLDSSDCHSTQDSNVYVVSQSLHLLRDTEASTKRPMFLVTHAPSSSRRTQHPC